MQIEVGKLYKTRGGYKYRVYATDGVGKFPVHGAVLMDDGWGFNTLTKDGFSSSEYQSPYDIISEWVETPEVDWSLYPKWWEYVAMDENGEWNGVWGAGLLCVINRWLFDAPDGMLQSVPPEYSPKFNGNWKDSLVKRPQ